VPAVLPINRLKYAGGRRERRTCEEATNAHTKAPRLLLVGIRSCVHSLIAVARAAQSPELHVVQLWRPPQLLEWCEREYFAERALELRVTRGGAATET
jgi:hypothetical protein